MRIVSFSPAATDWIRTFGAGGELAALPGQAAMPDDAGWLERVAPDVVVVDAQTYAQPSWSETEAELAARKGKPADVLVFTPTTLKQVLDGALRIGRAIGRGDAAMRWIAGAEARLQSLRQRLSLHRRVDEDLLPTVVVLRQPDPPVVAGYWVPDMVALAGGRSLLAGKGMPPIEMPWEAVLRADPDIVVLASGDTKANGHDHIYYVDGTGWLDLAGPRIYSGIEKLAAICAERKVGKP
ncbi:MAG TPA: ABC transporter substrate-binding protein [Rhodothermales bacterium]|nr:ABC transporter substrate-binding protein [Rhodothermales bacterium]